MLVELVGLMIEMKAKSFANASAANAVMVNTDGTNGGWTGATVENG